MSTNTDPKTNKPRKFVVVVPELFLETKESLSQLKAQRKEQQKLLQKQKLIQIREKRKRKSQKQKKASSRSQAPSQEHQLHQQQQQQVQTGNQEIANDQHHQQQQHQQQQQQQHFHNQGTGHNYALGFIQPTFDSQYPNKSPNVLASTDSLFPRLSSYDLKSKDSKYKRWTPRMDQLLIKLLSDVVHSYPRGAEPEMNKKAWLYVCKQLRYANPETVYSTYSKYSVLQHLSNVIQHRYKIWFQLMVHSKTITTGYSYKWNLTLGRFEIIDLITQSLILDSRQVKLILYGNTLSLPDLSQYNKSAIITNDFFLSDNLGYMSVYHNEILPVLAKLDSKYIEDIGIDGDIYTKVPKFDYPEGHNEYFKPLVPAKKPSNKRKKPEVFRQYLQTNGLHQYIEDDDQVGSSSTGMLQQFRRTLEEPIPLVFKDPIVDPSLRNTRIDANRSRLSSQRSQPPQPPQPPQEPQLPTFRPMQQSQQQLHHSYSAHPQQYQNHHQEVQMSIEIENALASAAKAASDSPSARANKDSTPYYLKDAKWFNKLLQLYDSGHIRADEVLCVCEGVRDNKIPLFMLNVLDHGYYPTRTPNNQPARAHSEEILDEETANRIRDFMLPMVYNS